MGIQNLTSIFFFFFFNNQPHFSRHNIQQGTQNHLNQKYQKLFLFYLFFYFYKRLIQLSFSKRCTVFFFRPEFNQRQPRHLSHLNRKKTFPGDLLLAKEHSYSDIFVLLCLSSVQFWKGGPCRSMTQHSHTISFFLFQLEVPMKWKLKYSSWRATLTKWK